LLIVASAKTYGVSAAAVDEPAPACTNPAEVLGENSNLLSQEQLVRPFYLLLLLDFVG
jgi:hypothetical protein